MSLGLLGTEYDTSSSSNSDDDSDSKDDNTIPSVTLANPFNDETSAVAPKPSFMVETKDFSNQSLSKEGGESSVFSNPFKKKQQETRAVLEQHINLTTRNEEHRVIGGKKVCWNFRKGRCRFGHKCTFAHDSDINLKKPNYFDATVASSDSSAASSGIAKPSTSLAPTPEVIPNGSKAKKRPGLSEGLVPNKKATKFHNKVYKS